MIGKNIMKIKYDKKIIDNLNVSLNDFTKEITSYENLPTKGFQEAKNKTTGLKEKLSQIANHEQFTPDELNRVIAERFSSILKKIEHINEFSNELLNKIKEKPKTESVIAGVFTYVENLFGQSPAKELQNVAHIASATDLLTILVENAVSETNILKKMVDNLESMKMEHQDQDVENLLDIKTKETETLLSLEFIREKQQENSKLLKYTADENKEQFDNIIAKIAKQKSPIDEAHLDLETKKLLKNADIILKHSETFRENLNLLKIKNTKDDDELLKLIQETAAKEPTTEINDVDIVALLQRADEAITNSSKDRQIKFSKSSPSPHNQNKDESQPSSPTNTRPNKPS